MCDIWARLKRHWIWIWCCTCDDGVFMDIKPNPGPSLMQETSSGSGLRQLHSRPQTNLHPKTSQHNRISYTRSQLFGLRKSADRSFMSYQTYRTLKILQVFRFRGKSGGKRRKEQSSNFSHLCFDGYANSTVTTLDFHPRSTYQEQMSDTSNNIPVHIGIRNCGYPSGPKFQSMSTIRQTSLSRNLICIKRLPQQQQNTQQNSSKIHLKPKLKVAHLNIQSMKNRNHLIQAKQLVSTENLDILTVSETWFNTTVKNCEVELPGYNLFRLDRLHKRGGGVCAFVKSNIKGKIIKNFTEISESGLHQLWIQVQHRKSKSLVICVTYRPPDCPLSCFSDRFMPTFTDALSLGKPLIVLGDLNCDLLKQGPEFDSINDLCASLNLTQIITEPTRITDRSSTLIDVILVSDMNLVEESGVVDVGISDHSLVYCILNLKFPRPVPSYAFVRSYKNYDPISFNTDISTTSFDQVYTAEDINTKVSTFNELFLGVLDHHAPLKTVKIHNRSLPFIDEEIKKAMKHRNTLKKRFRLTGDIEDWISYQASQRKVKAMLKKAEIDYFQDEINEHKGNTGSMWKTIRKILPSKLVTKPSYSKDTNLIANDFNKCFTSVGKKVAAEAKELLQVVGDVDPVTVTPNSLVTTTEPFSFHPISTYDIRKLIMLMPSNKAPGFQKISLRVIKDCLEYILPVLSDIINCSLMSCSYPDDWKYAEVIPLLKDGDHEVATNNRPLSLLPTISKICEKVVQKQLTAHLAKYNLLNCHQSGNRKYHSTESLNILTTDSFLNAMDQKKVSTLVLLDLSKAFDSLNHAILLQKLKSVGLSRDALNWFSSYLSGRSQAVRIGTSISCTLTITHGVPQGAILSPLLFTIYLNDLPTVTRNCSIESYVDDTKLFLSFPRNDMNDCIRTLEEDLRRVAHWCCINRLLINPDKTKVLHIGTRQMLNLLPHDYSNITLLGKQLTPVSSAKDLGIIIDSNLTFDANTTHIVSSCMSSLVQINRVKHLLGRGSLNLVINALVFNKLFYCSAVWANTTEKNIKKMQLVQNFAARVIYGLKKYDHVSPTLRLLKWLPVKETLRYRDTLMTFKCVHGLSPNYLSEKFSYSHHKYNTRSKSNGALIVPKHRTSSGQRSFTYRATNIWNSLEHSLKQETNIKKFKSKLKDILYNQIIH